MEATSSAAWPAALGGGARAGGGGGGPRTEPGGSRGLGPPRWRQARLGGARRRWAWALSGAVLAIWLRGATGNFDGLIAGNLKRLDIKKEVGDKSDQLGKNPHILLGEDESQLNSYRQIAMGSLKGSEWPAISDEACMAPGVMAFQETDTSISTKGDILFATRHNTSCMTLPTERVRVTSFGRLGVGTSTPEVQIHVKQDPTTSFHGNYTDGLLMKLENTGTVDGKSSNAGVLLQARGVDTRQFSILSSWKGNAFLVLGNGDDGPGGSMHVAAGNTTASREMGGALVMTAGAGDNARGGMGGWAAMTAGAAEGTEACTVEEYECWADFANAPTVDYLLDESVSYTNNEPEAPDVPQVLGRMVSAVVYKAVRSGCVKDCFYGVEVDSYTCQGVTVAAEDFVAARGFCRQRCLGGAVQVTGGLSAGGQGGAVVLQGGETIDADGGAGGSVELVGGESAEGTGGAVLIASGMGRSLTSGEVVVRSEMSGPGGVSGRVLVQTGTSCAGDSGGISLVTGQSTSGAGGDIQLLVGEGNTNDGGNVLVGAGETTDDFSTGGSVSVAAGLGSSSAGGAGGPLF